MNHPLRDADKSYKSESSIMEKQAPDKIQFLMLMCFFTCLGILIVAELTERVSQREED